MAQENPGWREDLLLDSFFNIRGILQVSQSAGDLNLFGNALGFSWREIALR